jgi:hypothetical protein
MPPTLRAALRFQIDQAATPGGQPGGDYEIQSPAGYVGAMWLTQ